jgi:riboflavin kinase/FMN adenylyltransferase
LLRPASAPALLTPMEHRLDLLAGTGVDAVVVLRFDASLARLPAREFVERVLVDAMGVRGMHEGGNFRFGCKAEAGVRELEAFGAEFGFGVSLHEPVHVHGLEVSSSAIRALVAAGDVKRARWMLGRPFSVRSTQKRDRGVGSKLLVPTINFADYDGLLPGFGIYVTQLTLSPQRTQRVPGPVAGDPGVGSRCFESVSSLGVRPTFDGAGFAVETHILDFEPIDHPMDEDQSAGAPIEMDESTVLELEFLHRLRDEEKYPTVELLKAQILRDVGNAKRYFRLVR